MRILAAADLRRVLSMEAAIGAMREASSTDREVPARMALAGSLIMPGRVGRHTGVKVVSTIPGNPAGLVVVFDHDGSPLGLVDGPELTRIRTGAASGLATDLLAPPRARVLAMLGAGAMAGDQVAAVLQVRPIERVIVWSRSLERARALAAALDGEAVRDADEAVGAADVVSCATPSRRPLFSDESVRPGTHVNAIGAFRPEMAEVPPETLERAYVVVDDDAAAREEAGDLIQADRFPVNATLTDLLQGTHPAIGEDVTVFKSVGIASQDVAAAVRALRTAEQLGVGTQAG